MEMYTATDTNSNYLLLIVRYAFYLFLVLTPTVEVKLILNVYDMSFHMYLLFIGKSMPRRKDDLAPIIDEEDFTELHDPVSVSTLPVTTEHSTLLPYSSYSQVSSNLTISSALLYYIYSVSLST